MTSESFRCLVCNKRFSVEYGPRWRPRCGATHVEQNGRTHARGATHEKPGRCYTQGKRHGDRIHPSRKPTHVVIGVDEQVEG